MGRKEKLTVEPYKGVRDFYPEDQAFLNYFLNTCRKTVERFGYVEYHASVLEPAELYRAKQAENQEIVDEQIYSFTDRGDREVALRPEMTPTVARLVAGRRRDFGFPLRLYSLPNVFRYERPQKGRLREHWQLNVDVFGTQSLAADAEIIAVAHGVMLSFGAAESDFVIKIGSRNFTASLVDRLNFNEEQSTQLHKLLDRRDKMPQVEFAKDLEALGVAAKLLSPEKPPEDVAAVLAQLTRMGITNAIFDPSIVRGFAYYTGVVFEIFDTHPTNNRALFGGGRYENLTALFDDEQIPGIGFGMGDVTMRDFLSERDLLPAYLPPTRAYLAVAGPESVDAAVALAARLRAEGVAVAVDFGEKKLGDQIKAASKNKIPYLIVVGDKEVSSGTFIARNLETGAESTLTSEQLASFFVNL